MDNISSSDILIQDLLAVALPTVLYLPVLVNNQAIPVVWIESKERQDLVDLAHRLQKIEDQFSLLKTFEIQRLYGQTQVRWIYAFTGQANAFFLWVQTQAPSFERPFLSLPSFSATFACSFNLDDPATLVALDAIVQTKQVALKFDPVPQWVQRLPPLRDDDRLLRGRTSGRQGMQLIRSSLPMEFRHDIVTKMSLQLKNWQERRE